MPEKSSQTLSADRLIELKEEIEEADPEQIKDEIKAPYTNSIQRGIVEFDDDAETVSPFNTTVKGPSKAAIEKIHKNRSERAQDVDEQQNAPVTLDEEQWIKHPDRYDYPDVDTIPAGRQQRRAERAAEIARETGAADRVEQKGNAKRLQGKFSPEMNDTYGRGENVVRVQNTAEEPERTLAHEIGHAFDYASAGDPETVETPSGGEAITSKARYGVSDLLFNADDVDESTLRDEAIELSKRARGDLERQPVYRRKDEELTADALAQTFIEPRAAKREAPNLFERVSQIAEQEDFADAIPDPLGADPEPRGFLD